MQLLIIKAGGKDLKGLLCKNGGGIRNNADRHTGMRSIFLQFFPVFRCQYIAIFIGLAVDLEFFSLMKNILYIGKGDGFLIDYFPEIQS